MENSHQKGLREWIMAGLAIDEIRNLDGDAGYILNNMIAKYSLYADAYLISRAARGKLEAAGVDLSRPVRRGAIYGKPKPTVFEHAVPATVVRAELLRSSGGARAVQRILQRCGPVAILTREEDAKLSDSGLSQSMPAGWRWGDDEMARYKSIGLMLSRGTVTMFGAVKR